MQRIMLTAVAALLALSAAAARADEPLSVAAYIKSADK
jgi:hypothetical protein